MPMHLDILDVGQGDGMVVWLPYGKVMMVDYGSTKNRGLIRQDSFKYFRDHTPFKDNGQTLDWLVLTHGDIDHYNQVERFLKEFGVNVRNILHGGLEAEYSGLIDRLRKRKNPDGTSAVIQTGAHQGFFTLDQYLGAGVAVIAIGVEAAGGSVGHIKNTRSVILRVVWKNARLLLAGDATTETEAQVMAPIIKGTVFVDAIKSNVLKVAHHGSHRSSSHAAFLALVNPQYAFISSDRMGSLDPDEEPTGHRLPQALTISLLRKYATRLRTDCGQHSYVMSYQKSDYEEYNAAPDIPGQTVDLPQSDRDITWIQQSSTEGIFSTLTTMGLGDNPQDEDAKDLGVQYRVTIDDNGIIDILSTADFTDFDQLGEVTA